MDESTLNSIYNEQYYSRYGHNYESYATNVAVITTLQRLARLLCQQFNPKTHMDFGCALGHLVSAMRSLNRESYGIDASQYAIDNAVPRARRYVKQCNVLDYPNLDGRKFDAVTCIEMIEHIEQQYENEVLDILCDTAPIIFFSSANDPDDPTHVNVHEQSYWKGKFLERGFICHTVSYSMIPWGNFYIKPNDYGQLRDLLDAQTRGKIYERDKFNCVVCGKNGVQVHEIIPRSAFGKSTMHQCYEEKNRVCLCPSCHSEAHTIEYRSKLLSLMKEKYGYEYTEQHYQRYGED